MQSLAPEHRCAIFSLLTDNDLWKVLLVSKSTHLDAVFVLSKRMQPARTILDELHAKLAQTYKENCWFVKPDETIVEFVTFNAEEDFTCDLKMRIEVKKPGRIEVTRTVRIDLTGPYALVSMLPRDQPSSKEHSVLLPNSKKRWIHLNFDDAFYMRPYPDDPVAWICNALDSGVWF